MTRLPTTSETLHEELMKLLIQVAWADHKLVQTEVTAIRQIAMALGLSKSALHDVETWLRGASKLPPPDLALLRLNREEVMRTATMVVLADGSVPTAENEILRDLNALLTDP